MLCYALTLLVLLEIQLRADREAPSPSRPRSIRLSLLDLSRTRKMASLPDVNTIALVTGAGSGFGKAVVELMVSRGSVLPSLARLKLTLFSSSKVIVADINLEHAKEVANALNTKAGETCIRCCVGGTAS